MIIEYNKDQGNVAKEIYKIVVRHVVYKKYKVILQIDYSITCIKLNLLEWKLQKEVRHARSASFIDSI